MAGLVPYITFGGIAREALTFHREVFGGEIDLHTFGEFGRDDGPADAIAHGALQGPVGANDGQVTDRFGVRWLIGYEN